jgi:type II secretory pathway component GspD/PulD (secretin)
VVETGTLTKIVPEADAKLQATPVSAGRVPSAAGDQVATQIFRLNYESATNLVPVLRPLITPNNTIVAYPNNNSLVGDPRIPNLSIFWPAEKPSMSFSMRKAVIPRLPSPVLA